MEKELVEQVKSLFIETDLTLQQIADKIGSTYEIVWRIVHLNFSKEERKERKTINYKKSKLGDLNPMFGKFASEHHNYEGEVSDGRGYIMVLKPSWYTGRKGSKHVFKHHVVICEALNMTEMPAGLCVHHIDFDKTNNDLDNLAIMTNSAHGKLHSYLKRATTIPRGSRE